MKKLTIANRTLCGVMIAVFVLSVAPMIAASTGDGIVSQVDEDSGSQVFGVVVATDGSPLPGVLITLSGGKVKQKTVSETDGGFSFASVPPGDYVMVMQVQGKKKLKREVPVASEDVDLGTIALD